MAAHDGKAAGLALAPAHGTRIPLTVAVGRRHQRGTRTLRDVDRLSGVALVGERQAVHVAELEFLNGRLPFFG